MPTPIAPGIYLYTDPIGSPPERLEVLLDGSDLVARFVDDGHVELVPVADMAGEFTPE